MKRYDLYYGKMMKMKDGMYVLYTDHLVEITAKDKEIARLRELSKAHEEYITLLSDEIKDLLVHAYGWRSPRVEQGKAMREKIEALNQELETDHD
jgi:hypothetical protein